MPRTIYLDFAYNRFISPRCYIDTHGKMGFDETEEVNDEPYGDEGDLYEGPRIDRADMQELRASQRFCRRAGGAWGLVKRSDNPRAIELVKEIASKCPIGGLVARSKGGRISSRT